MEILNEDNQPFQILEGEAAQKSVDARRAAIEALTQPTGTTYAPSVSEQTIEALRDRQVRRELDALIASPDPAESKLDALTDLQYRSNTVRISDAQLGMENEMRAVDNFQPLNAAQFELERLENLERARAGIESLVDRKSTGGTNTAVAVAEFVENVAVPTLTYNRFIQNLGEALPGLDIGGADFAVPHLAVRKVQDYLKSGDLSQQEFTAAIAAIQDVFEESSGFATEGGFEMYTWAQQLLTNLDGDEPIMAWGVETLANALDYVGLAFAARGVKSGVRALGSSIARGSPAHSAARTAGGLRRLLGMTETPEGEAALRTAGASRGSVIADSHVAQSPDLPPANGVAPSDVVPVEALYLSESERLRVLDSTNLWPGRRINSNVTTEADDGSVDILQRFGKESGEPFTRHQDAQRAATLAGLTDYSIVRVGTQATQDVFAAGPQAGNATGQFLIQMNQNRKWRITDAGEFDPGQVVGSDVLGQTLGFNEEWIRAKVVAASNTATEQAYLNQMLEPYRALTGKRQRDLNAIIEEGQGRQWFTSDELYARGMDEGQVLGYNAYRNLAERDYAVSNARARQSLEQDGFTQSFDLGSDDLVFVRPEPGRIAHEVIDLDTGSSKLVRESEVGQFYQLNEAKQVEGRWFTHAWQKKGSGVKGKPLPNQVLPELPGYLPRLNSATHYITKEVTRTVNGQPKTVPVIYASTRSDKRAREAAAALGEGYHWRRATEYEQGVAGSATRAGLADAPTARRFITHRRDEEILDLDSGTARLLSVNDTIQRMSYRTSLQQGLGVWADMQVSRLRARYPKAEFSLISGDPKWENLKGVDPAEIKAAKRAFAHVRRALGIDRNSAMPAVDAFRKELADGILDRGWERVGKEVAGVQGATLRAAKTLTATTMLVSNVARQWLMNMTMIPTYFSVAGAPRYMVTGGFLQDASILVASRMGGTETALQVGRAVGRGDNYTNRLLADLKESQLDSFVDDHVFLMDTLAGSNNRLAAQSRMGKTMQDSINLMADYGVKAGSRVDKYAAFLLSRNRFLTQNGRLPKGRREIQEVMSFAENELTLSQSRADISPLQAGSLSLLTQFQSHSIKYTGRILQQANAFIPSSLRRSSIGSGSLTAPELRRQAVLHLLAYGSAGYGGFKASEWVADAIGTDVPEPVKQLIDEGVAARLFSSMFELVDEAANGGDATKLAVSETFAPASFLGANLRGVWSAFASFISAGTVDGKLDLPALSVPALALAGSIGEVAKLGMALSFNPAVTSGEAFEVTLGRTARIFPLVNNAVRGLAAMNTGYAVDSLGRPITPISAGAAVARGLFGVQSQPESGYYDLLATRYGEEYQQLDNNGVTAAIQDQVDSDWRILEQALTATDRPAQYDRALQMIQDLASTRREQLKQEAWRYERGMQMKAAQFASDRPKADQLVTRLMNELRTRRRLPSDNYLDSIKQGYDFEGKQDLINYVEKLLSYDTGINLE